MNQEDYVENLKETLKLLDNAVKWLERSYKICASTGNAHKYSEDEFDAFETLSSRFARVSDILVQKVFRSIDSLELSDEGTLIDALNRAEKRGLIYSLDDIREIRDLRNQIVHEYVDEDLMSTFNDILKRTPKLLEIIKNTKIYCTKYFI
jgi:uncharacterized protein YutE (UPF0331/DUF86 family)